MTVRALSCGEAERTVYRPDGLVLASFLLSQSRVKIIQGPVGSGKSSVCAVDGYKTSLAQVCQSDGKRRARGHVFRDSYGKLEETTIPTWLHWFPEREYGRFYWSKPFRHEIRIGDLELDVTFVALEDIRSVDFFKSLETTWCWFNELQFIDRGLFNEAIGREGRYPPQSVGGAVEPKVIADTNAPPSEHWVPVMRGDVPVPDWMGEDQRKTLVKPASWEFFMQPAGLIERRGPDGAIVGYVENPAAENRSGLEEGYYLKLIGGKPRSWINANVMNRSDIVTGGKPVHKNYDPARHLSKTRLVPIQGLRILVGLDFGRQPAAVFAQYLRGQWYIYRELIGLDMGAVQFAPLVRAELAQHFPGFEYQLWGDPSGDFRGQNDDDTPFQIFRTFGLHVMPAPTNLFTVRVQATDTIIERHHGLLVSPNCTTYNAGMAGGYHCRRMAVAGEQYTDEPVKNPYSHVCEAGHYVFMGGGEGRDLLFGAGHKPGQGVGKVINTIRKWSPLRRPVLENRR